jgi:hypothetical protein
MVANRFAVAGAPDDFANSLAKRCATLHEGPRSMSVELADNTLRLCKQRNVGCACLLISLWRNCLSIIVQGAEQLLAALIDGFRQTVDFFKQHRDGAGTDRAQ